MQALKNLLSTPKSPSTHIMSRPAYLYKITPHSSVDARFTFPIPVPASHELTLPQLDYDDGFVHTSSALQVPDTLRLFFKDCPQVWLYRMDVARLSNWRKIDWVEGTGVKSTASAPMHVCAHLHRPWLKGEEIESVLSVAQKGGSWEEALESPEVKQWLKQ